MSVNDPVVSVIVPAYNAERYIGRLLDSILCQTYSDWELLITDDGSIDGTRAIIEDYALRDSRIRVISSSCKGVSGARNSAIDAARGKYLCFADSDDLLDPDYLKTLLDHASDDADIIQCSFCFTDDAGNRTPDPYPVDNIYTETDKIIDAFLSGPAGNIRVSVWGKLFRRDAFSDVRFDTDLRVCEDSLYVYECCKRASKVVCFSTPLYIYRQHEGSVMDSGLTANYKDYFKVFDRERCDLRDNSSHCRKIARREAEATLWLMRFFVNSGTGDVLWELRKRALGVAGKVICSSAPIRLKMKLISVAVTPHIYFSMLARKVVSGNA